ncbi:hypothetical protein [Ulvibacter litoralis]|uniref:hypothetical protein n=1 Tax=Ulvibacter litoralis TaxID=227084 RepID=UPI00111302F2|nr:hypothetical protein [Ulvibacter litoralis]
MSFSSLAQVGIGTTEPTAALDINGTLRIREFSEETNVAIAKDSILVISRNGNVSRISSKKIIESSLVTSIKGHIESSTNVSIPVIDGVVKVPYNDMEFDMNDEFDTNTATFTAKQDGIYHVFAQIKTRSTIAVSQEVGIMILKNGSIISKNSYANVGISPPIRSTQSLVKLNANETISFNIISSLESISMYANKDESYFTIHQIR